MPRATLEPDDLVTPGRFAELTGIPVNRVRVWIHRSMDILGRRVEPVGQLGRWPAYDWNDLAALESTMRRRQQQRQAAALPARGQGAGMPYTASDLLPGMYVCVQTKGFYPGLIRAFTGSPWTHVFPYLGDGNIVQADTGGIRVAPLARYHGAPAVANITEPITDIQRTIVCATARSYTGLEYGYGDATVIGLRHLGIRWHWLSRIADNPDAQICSALTARSGLAAQLTTWLCGETDPAFVVPGELAARPGVEPVTI